MKSRLARALLGLTVGALAGVLAVAVGYASAPGVLLDMGRYLPDLTPGFSEPELAGDTLFAWTAEQGSLQLRGLDRRIEWNCTIRLTGGMRPLHVPMPSEIAFSADGIVLSRVTPTDTFADYFVTVPARPQVAGLMLTIRPSASFVPGDQDRRHLGVAVGHLACAPAPGRWPLPPAAVLVSAAFAAGAFAAAAGLLGLGAAGVVLAGIAIALLQAFPLTVQFAPYGEYAVRVRWMATWAWCPLLVLAAWQLIRRRDFVAQSLAVALFSASSFYLKLLALLHPAKDVVDAIFQAHRFEWVLAGQYYFTSVTPRGYKFPYAIGLYLVAAPFASLMDHVSLLRVIVLATWMVAGVALYLITARVWHDRLAGAVAAVLFNTVPIVFDVVASANHPNAFGETMAPVAVCAFVWLIDRRSRFLWAVPAVAMLIVVALLSHLSTFATLSVTLLAASAAVWWWGSGVLKRRALWAGVLVTGMIVVAVVVYYGHFPDIYLGQLNRVRAETGNLPASRTFVLVDPTQRRDVAPGTAPAAPPFWMRLVQPVTQAGTSFGWPTLALALAGGWQLRRSRRRDPLTLVLVGWLGMFLLFFLLGMWTPVEMRYHLSTSGAVALLGGFGAAELWRRSGLLRVAGVLLVLGSVVGALATCARWLV
jgi:hypothetical protein